MQAPSAALPERRAYAAVDLGASSGRVVLGVPDGDAGWRFTEVHRFANEVSEMEGVDVWDVEHLYAETLVGLRRAGATCESEGYRLAGIGVDSWGVDWTLVDADGRAELPVRSYRGAPDPAPVVAGRPLSVESVYALSGIPDHAINTALRLSAESTLGTADGRTLLFVPDLWVYWLTGKIGTDPTIASTSQLLRADTPAFTPELSSAVGVSNDALPRVHAVGSVVGPLTSEARSATGLGAEVTVFRCAGHDTAAAFAFADPSRDGVAEVLISSGTWSLVGAALAAPLTTEEARLRGFSNEHGATGTLLLQNQTGLWILQECLREWGSPDLASLLESVQRLPFDPRTFTTSAPELFGTGPMETRVRALCIAAGRALPNGRVSVVHAIIDSLAAAYASGVRDTVALTGVQPARIRIVGGGSRNDRLCRLTAELTGLPVIAGPAEATAIGTVAIQAAADGAVSHPAEVFDALDDAHVRHYPTTDTALVKETPA